ncbi:MAG: 4-hydroxy-tetrahydrodipicolinate reductase [Candidatus Kapaibacterium sp.]
MNIVISGYGKMGQEIESVVKSRGGKCIAVLTKSESLRKTILQDSICIDFTTPEAFRKNYKHICNNFKAAVVGTTGWNDIKDEVIGYFKDKNKTLIYATNFSIGVNIFFKITELSSKIISTLTNYDAYIVEMHHKQKIDAPSGTAKTLEKILEDNLSKKAEIHSIRSGYIKGIHEVGYESEVDRITLKHEAYTRKGFAEGAVTAAEWTDDISGVYEFKELLENKFKEIKL